MKIAFSAEGSDLDATVDPRFGRCKQFLIIDSTDLSFDVLPNLGQDAESSAGIMAAQALVEKSIDAVASGHVGPNARQVLDAAGIPVYENVSGTIRDAIQVIQSGAAPSGAEQPDPASSSSPRSSNTAAFRIAVSIDADHGLDSPVSAHFGRCAKYLFADIANGQVRTFHTADNPFYHDHGQPGQVPNFIHDQQVRVMIAGGMGPRAIQFFEQFGIETVTGASGKASEAIDAYLSGSLESGGPCEHEHGHGDGHECHE